VSFDIARSSFVVQMMSANVEVKGHASLSLPQRRTDIRIIAVTSPPCFCHHFPTRRAFWTIIRSLSLSLSLSLSFLCFSSYARSFAAKVYRTIAATRAISSNERLREPVETRRSPFSFSNTDILIRSKTGCQSAPSRAPSGISKINSTF